MVKAEECNAANLSEFDFVVLAGSVYIGKWMLREWVKQNSEPLKSKKLFFVIVCGTPSSNPEEQQRLAIANIPIPLRLNSDVIFLRGRVIIKKLSMLDKLALKVASRMEKDPVKKKEMKEGYDEVSRTKLVEVIKAVRAYLSSAKPKKSAATVV